MSGAAAAWAAAWLLTVLVEGTLLLGAAWLAGRTVLREHPARREFVWRAAVAVVLVAPLFQLAAGRSVLVGPVLERTAPDRPVHSAPPGERVGEIGRTGAREVGGTEDTRPERTAADAQEVAGAEDTRPERAAADAQEVAGAEDVRPERVAADAPVRDTARREPVAGSGGGRARPGFAQPGAGRQGAGAAGEPSGVAYGEGLEAWGALVVRSALRVWLAGALLGVLLVLSRHMRFRRSLGPRRPVREAGLVAVLQGLVRDEPGLARVRLTGSPALPAPATLSRREICLPWPRFAALDRARQRALLAHELAHVERNDPAWRWTAQLLATILWFQPLFQVARRELRDASELLADERAVRWTRAPAVVAAALGEVAGWVGSGHREYAVGAADGGSSLVRRVRAILAAPPRTPSEWSPPARRVLGLAALAVVTLALPAFSVVPVEPVVGARSSAVEPVSSGEAEGPRAADVPVGAERRARSARAPVSGEDSTGGALGGSKRAGLLGAPTSENDTARVGPGESGRARPPERSSSASYEIVENARPLLADGAWTVAATPSMTCASAGPDGDPRVAAVTDLVPLGPRRVAILSFEHATLLLCEEGRVTRSFGSRGEGPGRFASSPLAAMAAPGDSVAALSFRKAVLFDAEDGGFRELWRHEAGSDDHLSLLLETSGGLAGSRFTDGVIRPEGEGEVEIQLLGWDGRVHGLIGPVPWSTSLETSTANALWGVDVPFTLTDSTYWFASRDSLALHRYTPDGLDRVVRAPTLAVSVDDEHRDRAVRRMRDDWGWPAERVRTWVRRETSGPGREHAPAVLALLTDDTGRLWVRLPEPRPDVDPRLWRVFTADGAWITDVHLPPGYDLHAVRDDRLYGVTRKPDWGPETVEVRRLVR